MSHYRMLSIDLDGTLLTSGKRITPRTEAAVRRACDAGVEVAICSARPPRSARPFYDALGLDAELIAYNGAMIVRLTSAPDPEPASKSMFFPSGNSTNVARPSR